MFTSPRDTMSVIVFLKIQLRKPGSYRNNKYFRAKQNKIFNEYTVHQNIHVKRWSETIYIFLYLKLNNWKHILNYSIFKSIS
jgi:hypothetical protein